MLTFEELNLKEAETIFKIVDEACRSLRIDFYLIGGQAVNFNLTKARRSLVRVTKDLDEAHFMQEAGACMLGRDLREILNHSPSLRQTIQDIFEPELSDQPGRIGKYFVAKGYFETWEDFKRVLSLIHQHMQ